MAGVPGPSLLLAPSVRTEVVTTTTVTTTSYAPITLPPLPPPPVPTDPKQYPLLHARFPRSLEEFNIVFPDGAQATFRSTSAAGSRSGVVEDANNDAHDTFSRLGDDGHHTYTRPDDDEVLGGSGWKMLRKDEIPKGEEVDIATAIERFNRRKRGSLSVSGRGDAMDGVELSSPLPSPARKPRRSSARTPPPSSSLRTNVEVQMRGPSGSTTSAAAPPSPLPSPTGSPAPSFFFDHTPTHSISQPVPSTQSSGSARLNAAPSDSRQHSGGGPLQPDVQLTTLMTLPTLLTQYSALPSNLQSHVILTLLRQSPMPVLRNINAILAPTLSKDFLTQLPAELVSIILSYLPGRALAQCTRVSKAWRAIIDSDPILWRELLRSTGSWFGGGAERAFARTLMNRRELKLDVSSASSLDLPHPYKVLYKSRQLTRTQWQENQHPKMVSFAAHGNSVVTCLLFSHNRIISASDDHSIHVYNPLTGQLVKSLEGHGGGVWALAATKDTLVSGSTDRTVRIWDLEKGRCTHVFGGHKSTVRCLAIVKPELLDIEVEDPSSSSGVTYRRERWPKRTLIVTGSRDHTLRVWKLPKAYEPSFVFTPEEEGADHVEVADNNPYHLRLLSGHGSAVRALAARGRTLVSGSYDHTVRVWDIITGVCRWVLSGHTQKVYSIVLDHARDQACSGSMDSSVRIWNLKNGQCVHVLTGHTSLVGLLGLSHSYLVSAAADSTLRVWDPSTGELLHTLAAHTGAITCFQHDEFKILSGSDGTLKMWDIRDGTNVRDLLTGITGVWQVVFDGRWCVAASNRHDATFLNVWDFGNDVVGDGDEEWVGEASVDGEDGDSELDEDVTEAFMEALHGTAAQTTHQGETEEMEEDHEQEADEEPAEVDADEDMGQEGGGATAAAVDRAATIRASKRPAYHAESSHRGRRYGVGVTAGDLTREDSFSPSLASASQSLTQTWASSIQGSVGDATPREELPVSSPSNLTHSGEIAPVLSPSLLPPRAPSGAGALLFGPSSFVGPSSSSAFGVGGYEEASGSSGVTGLGIAVPPMGEPVAPQNVTPTGPSRSGSSGPPPIGIWGSDSAGGSSGGGTYGPGPGIRGLGLTGQQSDETPSRPSRVRRK